MRDRFVAGTVLVAVATLSVVAAPSAQAATTVVTMPSPPVAYQPLSVQVTSDACLVGEEASVHLSRFNTSGDVTAFNPDLYGDPVVVPPSGTVVATATVPVAFPGQWIAGLQCTGVGPVGGEYIQVPDASGQTATVSRNSVTVGDVITASGGGCPGGVVSWYFDGQNGGPFYLGWPGQGTIIPKADGTWSGPVTVSGVQGTGPGYFASRCEFPGGVYVIYPNVPMTISPAATSSTSTTTPTTSTPAPVTATPRFTG